jgi:hypothetical protein
MPKVRRLEQDEVQTLERKPGVRVQTAALFDRLLEPFSVGDYGEVTLEPEENRLTVRNRLRKAAERKGATVRMLRTPRDGDTLRFQLVEG